ncbi:hypothetical protein BDK51DRAFT_28191 [Blyttiomyces helicus]|uniref:RNA-polymerase II-associated protein 3-like C-terminal domain-containing protein n=1 Tax=Blyttiomyces helicus TaxID=388810 RepID=A0A4P9WEZ0_9FUNG|nr:hypothetical protein BDK51DRAFT_28191 [Blyttiomyces helicus]|eukprot:RKO89858.1 hypothetical protein BDK51DRAFT_28191 [Blyttiomyces helicus]
MQSLLKTNDIQNLSKVLDPSKDGEEFEREAPSDYDVTHMDFGYVEKCTDIAELKTLLRVLKSGKEGIYTELEDAMQRRIEELDPSLVIPVNTPLSRDDLQELERDIFEWSREVRSKDTTLKATRAKPASNVSVRRIPEAQPQAISAPAAEQSSIPFKHTAAEEPQSTPKSSNRIRSSDYRAWDRLDVDAELQRLEEEDEKEEDMRLTRDNAGVSDVLEKSDAGSKAKINKAVNKAVPVDVKPPAGANMQELEFLAEMEKNKGNEALKAGEIQDAAAYYTRSLNILKRANVYTNRSLAYFKLKMFSEAEDDATAALNLDNARFNFKALFRRAKARYSRGHYLEAIGDLNAAMDLDPSSREVLLMRREVEEKYRDVEGRAAAEVPEAPGVKRNKMKIVEVDDEGRDGEEEAEEEWGPFCGSADKGHGPKIMEILDEETDAELPSKNTTEAPGTLKEGSGLPDVMCSASPANNYTFAMDSSAGATVDNDESDEDEEWKPISICDMEEEAKEEESPSTATSSELEKAPTQVSEAQATEVEVPIDGGVGGPTEVPLPENATDRSIPQSLNTSSSVESASAPSRPVWNRPIANTSFEFESGWKSLRRDIPSWAKYLERVPADHLPRLLGATNTADIVSDIISALAVLIEGRIGFLKFSVVAGAK